MTRPRAVPAILAALAVAVALAAAAVPPAAAQSTSPNDGITPLALAPGRPAGSFPLSGFESVHLYGGNLSFALPLLRVGGRGEAGFTMHLAIERRWSLRLANPRKLPGEPERYAAEWDWTAKPGYSPGVMHLRSATQRVSLDADTQLVRSQEVLTRLAFRRGDGTEHDFRDDASDGQVKRWWEGKAPFVRGARWHSTDGSAATFLSDAAIRDPGATPQPTRPVSGRLLLKDGTEYRIGDGAGGAPGRVTRIRDRNGNVVALDYDGGNLTRVTDPLGRVVTVEYRRSGEPWEDVIRHGGFGGSTREIVVRHRLLRDCLADGESLRTFGQLFPGLVMASPDAFDPRVACQVELPNGTLYDFAYNAYGELASVVLPTGGRIEYEWASGVPDNASGLVSLGSGGDGRVWSYAVSRRVTSRKVYNYGELEQWAEYDASACAGSRHCRVEVRHLDPDGRLVRRERHSFSGNPLASLGLEPCDYPAWTDGRPTEVEVLDEGGSRLRSVASEWQQRASVPWSTPSTEIRGEPPNDVRLVKTVTTVDDDAERRSVVQYEHDGFNNVTATIKRGHGGGVLRETRRAFRAGAYAADAVHVRDLPEWEEVRDGAGALAARTDYEYDGAEGGLLARPGIVGWVDVGRAERGNLTAVRRWLDWPRRGDAATEAVTRRRYDAAGSLWKETDPEGRATTWSYDDNYGRPDGNLSGGEDRGTFARPTLVRNPLGHETRTQFDYATGLPVNQRDPAGVVTMLEYHDPLDRLTRVVRAANVGLEPWKTQTSFDYTDGRWRREVRTSADQVDFDDGARKTRVLYDELGREWQAARKAPAPQPWIAVDKRYDALGRLARVSNPYDEAGEIRQLWTTTEYDALDRPFAVATPDGAVVSTHYAGPETLVVDAMGRMRRSVTDAAGRVVSVTEYPEGAGPWATEYAWDTLDHLTSVKQGPQPPRRFLYDSLGRLREAWNPESGRVRYEHDLAGVLTWRRDARGVETTYAADALGRPTRRTYSDGTPAVSFAWDEDPAGRVAASPGSIGRLVAVDNAASSTLYVHDPLGRVTASTQTTDGRAFPFAYTHDRAGNLVEERYPSGRVVTTETDRLDRVTAVLDTGLLRASDFLYAPHGAARSVRLGNGLTETTRFNVRLQPEAVGLGSDAAGPLLGLAYQYWPEGAPPQRNDGNVWVQTVTAAAPGGAPSTLTQLYAYDGLNRLASASEPGAWSQTYRYDRWGNRVVTGWVPQPAHSADSLDAHVDPQTNRLHVGSATYDPSGNQTADPLGRALTYDAENRQTAFAAGAASADGRSLGTTYAYDGDGRRVLSTGPSGRTVLVYDALGRLAAEYSSTAPPAVGAHYLTADPLGSVRIVTDDAGRVVSRHDYLPFGEEIPATVGPRAALADYAGADPVRHRFTGKERDRESGLDYFGARYYAGAQGRFTGADPDNAGAILVEPQSWNGYSYTLNNPLRYVDPDGEAADILWDAANVSMGVASFVSNAKAGNTGAAVLDAVGVLVDSAAAAVPFIPGGAGTIIKGVRAADKAVDVVKSLDKASDAAKAADRLVDAATSAKAAESALDVTPPLPQAAYRRPSGATTPQQRAAVQGKPCVECGKVDGKKYADHIDPLVKQHYEGRGIDRKKMRDPSAVQSHCPTCSNKQGAELSRYSKAKKRELGLE